MYYEELEGQIDFLMSAALQKCGDIGEAEELTQETLLAALTYLSRDRKIENLRGWLVTVMNRRFYDMMRKKYRRPYISMGSDFELEDEENAIEKIGDADEAEAVRREVAYLGKIYREVIVRHYMDGEGVAEIAAALNIPQGTVKHRLYIGRNQIKKGITEMENYTKLSYEPVTLWVSNSGRCGLNGEPRSLVLGDLMAQNLLWLAYEKPATIDELSRAIGIPSAYVEPVIEKLTAGEMMRKVGNRYYTDFIISTIQDQERYIPAQKQFVQENFRMIWKSVGEGLCRVRESEVYKRYNFDQRNSLEMYFVFKCLEEGYYGAFNQIFQTRQTIPDRPDGGAWIAMGCVRFKDHDPKEHRELTSCMWSGERWVRYDDYGNAGRIELHVYGTEGFPGPRYDHCFEDIPHIHRSEGEDAELLKMFYILYAGLNPNQMGFNTEALKAVPWLVKCRLLRLENGRPVVNIPVMGMEEFRKFQELCWKTAHALIADNRDLLAVFYQGKRQPIPPHLDSVPLQKQYLWSDYALMLSTVREAIKQGELYDGDYDNVNGENSPACPMVLIIDP